MTLDFTKLAVALIAIGIGIGICTVLLAILIASTIGLIHP